MEHCHHRSSSPLSAFRTGIQRPLKDINELTKSIYIPKGVNIPSLDQQAQYLFQPEKSVKVLILIVFNTCLAYICISMHMNTFCFYFYTFLFTFPQIGSHLTGGDIFGYVQENSLVVHRIMVPPKVKGTVKHIAHQGNHTIQVSSFIQLFMWTL